jgi:pantoate kinase
VLQDGVITKVLVESGKGLNIKIEGDGKRAKTTKRAIEILLEKAGITGKTIFVSQEVRVPVGYGFGASAAASLSAVLATSSALGLNWKREEVALCAHMAEIQCSTGLGTVSAIYRAGEAGVITKPGGPGIAEFVKVKTEGLRILTVCIRPMEKKHVIFSDKKRRLVNIYGKECLERLIQRMTIDELASCGEYFTERVGIASRELKKIIKKAKEAGAAFASQNMIGEAMHALVFSDSVEKVKKSLESYNVKEFLIGKSGAKLIKV